MADRNATATWIPLAGVQRPCGVKDVERLHKKTYLEMKTLREIIGQAVVHGKLTRAQGSSLLRHRRLHTEGHMLFMIRLMVEKHMTFSAAHEAAMRQVGK